MNRLVSLRVDVVQVSDSDLGAALAAYKADPRVEFAEPDFIGAAVETPNDSQFSKHWGMSTVQAPLAWNKTKGSAGVKIAVLDTGIDQNHPDLKSKIVNTKNFTGNDCSGSGSVDDKHGHGTHVSGIAAAATGNAIGVAGLGRDSSLMVGKVLDEQGKGYYSWWICGITWAADNGAKVINLSLGGTNSSTALKSAIDYAWNKGVVVVAAAGNGGNTQAFYPAFYSNAIAVASTKSNDTLSSFSNRGSWVDVAAPGEGIYSTIPNHNSALGSTSYGTLSLTSMAAPHVAGLAELILANGGTSASQVRGTLQSSADKISGTGSSFAYGRINAARAVGATTPVVTPPATPPPPTNVVTPPPTTSPTKLAPGRRRR